MARRRKGRGKKSKSIPILVAMPALMPALTAYSNVGLTKALPEQLMYRYTGYHKDAGFQSSVLLTAAAPIIVGYVGHKVANKLGVNKWVKKATMGFFSL